MQKEEDRWTRYANCDRVIDQPHLPSFLGALLAQEGAMDGPTVSLGGEALRTPRSERGALTI